MFLDFMLSFGLLALIVLAFVFSSIWLWRNTNDILRDGLGFLGFAIKDVEEAVWNLSDVLLSSDLTAKIRSDKPLSDKSLSQIYYEDTKRNGATIMYGNRTAGNWAAEIVLQQLKMYYDRFEEISRSIDADRRIIRFKGVKDNDVAYFEVQSIVYNAQGFQKPKHFDLSAISVGMDSYRTEIPKEEGKDEYIYMIETLKMVYTGAAAIKSDVLNASMKASELKFKQLKLNTEEMIRDYSLGMGLEGNFYLNGKLIKDYSHPIKYPDLQFSVDELIYNGSKLDVKGLSFEDLLAAIEIGLSEPRPQNILIFGPRGSLKSTLQTYFKIQASKMKGTRVVQVSPDFIKKMSGIRFNQFLERECSNMTDKEAKEKLIFSIDEANVGLKKGSDAARGFLAQLDGDFRNRFNLGYFLVSNTPKEELVPDVMRDGRFDLIITLGFLKKDKTYELADAITADLPPNRVFNRDKLDKNLSEDSMLDGQDAVYSPKNQVVAGQVFTCIQNPAQLSKFHSKMKTISAPIPKKKSLLRSVKKKSKE